MPSAEADHCRAVVGKAFGRVDVLVSNAAFQLTRDALEDIPDEEWDHTFKTNIYAMFHLCKAALPHMPEGGSIIGSTSVNSDAPPPQLLAYNRRTRDRRTARAVSHAVRPHRRDLGGQPCPTAWRTAPASTTPNGTTTSTC